VFRPRAFAAPRFSGASGSLEGGWSEDSAGKQQPARTDAAGLAVAEAPAGVLHMLGLPDPGVKTGLELGGQA